MIQDSAVAAEYGVWSFEKKTLLGAGLMWLMVSYTYITIYYYLILRLSYLNLQYFSPN